MNKCMYLTGVTFHRLKQVMDIDLGERVVRVDDGAAFYQLLTRVQAMMRAARVHKHLLETRRQFEVLFNEVEERTLLQLTWPRNLLCAPVLSYSPYSKLSKSRSAPTCIDSTTEPQKVTVDEHADNCPRGTWPIGSCSCCACHQVEPHWSGVSVGVDVIATAKATVRDENSDVCNLKELENCVAVTDTDDSQSRPTCDSCQVDFRSVSPTPMTQNDTRCHPCDNEQNSQSQQDSVRTNTTVDEVDGEESSHDTSSFRHKNVLGAQGECNGQEPLPPGRGGGYLKDDIVKRNAPSVWDSFDGSTVLESRDSLQGEDRTSLEEKKGNITMELLWIQQAIDSRKQYLRLKTRMAQTAS